MRFGPDEYEQLALDSIEASHGVTSTQRDGQLAKANVFATLALAAAIDANSNPPLTLPQQ